MEKLLSDIAVSRSAPVAIFLELEAAARSCMFSLTYLNIMFCLCMLDFELVLCFLKEYKEQSV